MRVLPPSIGQPLKWATLLLCTSIILAGSTFAARAQDDPAVPAQPVDQAAPGSDEDSTENLIDRDRVEQRIAELEEIADPDDETRDELASLNAILESLKTHAAAEKHLNELRQLEQDAPQRLEQIEQEIQELTRTAGPEFPPVDPDLSAEQLNVLLDRVRGEREAARADLQAHQSLLSQLHETIEEHDERQAAIPGELAETREALNEVEEALAALADEEGAESDRRERAALRARQRLLSTRLELLQQEAAVAPQQRTLLDARQELGELRVEEAEQLVDVLQRRVDSIRLTIAGVLRREAQEAAREAGQRYPLVEKIEQQTAELAAELEDLYELKGRMEERLQSVESALTSWRNDLTEDKAEVARAGLTEVMGIHLRHQLAELPNVHDFRELMRSIRRQMREIQSRRYEIEALTFEDAKREALQRLREADGAVSGEQSDEVLARLVEALESQKRVLDRLRDAYDYSSGDVSILPELHRRTAQLIDTIEEYREFIDARILWIQSTSPIGLKEVRRAGEAIGWIISPHNWTATGRAWWQAARSDPLRLLLGIITVILLAMVRRWARKQMRDIAQRVKRAATDRFALSVQATIYTLLIPAVWPALLWFLGWHLSLSADASSFPGAVAVGMQRVAVLLYAALLLREVCRRSGLGQAHFRWHESRMKLIRRHLRWLIAVTLPLAFVVTLTVDGDYPLHANSLGRLAFVLAMLAVALFLHRVFHPGTGVLAGIIARHRGEWLDRLRFVWFAAIVLAPIALAIVALLGFFYTALQLERRLIVSSLLILAVLVGHQLMLRWLLVAHRRLALEQARKKAAVRAQAAAVKAEAREGEAAELAPKEAIQIEEVEVDVASLSAQTRRLLRTGAVFALVIGLLLVWAEVLPALGLLDTVEVWQVQTVEAAFDPGLGADAVGGEGGLEEAAEAVAAPVEEAAAAVSLADIGIAIVILVLLVIISRDIPGLLEIAILQRLPITPGGRYATVTVVRYFIVIVGLVLAFNAIGIGWSKVQWLAAAITVGLGFGLQEIFANFVSGLIILFERPIRLGDTVTVSDISGTVSRIRMRATTITDWDRKELIIPNKEFITGNVVNWSLSDAMLRIRVPVGIAYGSDTEKARDILLQVAKEHEVVLKDPAPQALFLGFGESSLDFELRIFVPSIEHFIELRHEMHMKIDEAFREAKIEIAFPQRDIHVRSISAGLPVELGDSRAGKAEPAG